MNEPTRTQWQIRCAFNGFCKETLRNEAAKAHNHVKWRQSKETTFSNLSIQEENQLYTYDSYFTDDEAENSFYVAGKEISAKLLAEAMRSLPEEKRKAVLLYYFFDMSDAEIAELYAIPRSAVQYRRTSSFIIKEEARKRRGSQNNSLQTYLALSMSAKSWFKNSGHCNMYYKDNDNESLETQVWGTLFMICLLLQISI